MGACCQSTTYQNVGEHNCDRTPTILLPKKQRFQAQQQEEFVGDIDIKEQDQINDNPKINSAFKQSKRKNPKYDPYQHCNNTKKHECQNSISKMLQGFNGNIFQNHNTTQEEIEQALQEHKQNKQQIDQYDISTQIHLQIVTDKYQLCLKQFQQSGEKKFIDPEFPHNKDSISKYPEYGLQDAENYEWLPAKECVDKEKNQDLAVFQGIIEPNDIKQGQLGDCYFLCGLSALAERPGLIKRLFKTKYVQENGMYCIWLCVNGEWQEVILDDYFPCYNKRPVFSQAKGDELWVLLMEKAYAKVFGSYIKIQAGLTGEAIRDLTGAPSKWIPTSMGPDKVWDFIQSHDDLGHIMTAGSQQEAPKMDEALEGRREQDMGQGIVSGHAYAILDHRVIYTAQAIEYRLVQLKNPWGQYEWKGDWSDGSDKWSHELKQQLGVEESDDGIFWMEVTDLCKEFSDITTNMLHENGDDDTYQYNSMKIQFPQNKFRALVKFISPKNGVKGYIQVSQKDQRFFNCEPYINYEYSNVSLVVCKHDYTQYIGDISYSDRDIFVQNEFEQGVYYAYIEVDWSNNRYDADFVTISSYASEQLLFKEYKILDQEEDYIIDKMFLCKPPQNPEKVHKFEQHDIQRYVNQAAGYITFNYYNFTNNITIQEQVNLQNRQYLNIQPPYTNSDQFSINLKPQETKIVKYKIDKEGQGSYSYGASFQSDVLLNDEDLIQEIKEQPKSVDQREFNGEKMPIWAFTYFYSHGLALYWENQSEFTYSEKLYLNLTNLDFEDDSEVNYDDNPLPHVQVILNPGVNRLIKLKIVDSEYGVSFGSSCQYKIE